MGNEEYKKNIGRLIRYKLPSWARALWPQSAFFMITGFVDDGANTKYPYYELTTADTGQKLYHSVKTFDNNYEWADE